MRKPIYSARKGLLPKLPENIIQVQLMRDYHENHVVMFGKHEFGRISEVRKGV